MANDIIRFATGSESNLSSVTKEAGKILFAITEDNKGYIYFDKDSNTRIKMSEHATTAASLKNLRTFTIKDDSQTNAGAASTFNGTQDIILRMPPNAKFTNLTATSNITLDTGNFDIVNIKETDKFINFYYDANKTSGASWRIGHIGSGSGDTNYFVIQSGTSATGNTSWNNVMRLGMNTYDAYFAGNVNPFVTNTKTLGTSSLKWKNVYATTFTGNLTGLAEKATGDSAGDNIRNTYLANVLENESTINSYSIISKTGGNTTKNTINIPNASTTKAGLITGETQTIGGEKTFNDKITANEDIISLKGEPYICQKEFNNVLCTANNDPNGYLYYGQLKLKDYYTEWYLKMYISMDIPYDSTKTGTNAASYEGVVEYWGYANTITAYRIFNAHASTSYRTFYQHVSYRPKLAGCQTYGHLLGFRFYSSWNPATTGYGRNIKIKVLHTDNCTFNFFDSMILYANAPGTGTTNFDGRSEYDGVNNGLRETGDDNTRNHLIGAANLEAGVSCIDRYTIVMQEKDGGFSSICYKAATSNSNDTSTAHIKSTAHYVVGGPVYYAYSNAHTNAETVSSSQEFHTNYPLDFRYSSNAGNDALVRGEMLYLKFEKDSEGYLVISDHPWYSQELPTEEDGYVYMSLGVPYGSNNRTNTVYMFPEHEYYEYINGQIRKYVHTLPVKQGGTGKTSWTANGIVYASNSTTLSSLGTGTDGQLLKSKGANAAPEWTSVSDISVEQANKDGKGDIIAESYIKYGTVVISDTDHTFTYKNNNNQTTQLSLPFVKLSGDTMSGDLIVSKTSGDSRVSTTNGKKVSLLSSTNRGLYDDTTSKWIIYRLSDGTKTYIIQNDKSWSFDNSGNLNTPAGATTTENLIGTASRAVGDSKGSTITTTYATVGNFSTDDTNHQIVYKDNTNTSYQFSTPFVKLSGDTMTGNLSTSGSMTATGGFIGDLTGNATSASFLKHKTVNNTTLNNTAGSFAFSGSGDPWVNTDWVGLQIGDDVDKFQIVGSGNTLLFRQNDSGGTNTSWTGWRAFPYILQNTAKGSNTKPVWIDTTGEIKECTYELKATVNNATQYGVAYYSTTTNITSTAAGGANTALMGKGTSTAPAFVSVNPTLTLTAGTTDGPKVKISVLGVTGTDLQIPAATNDAAGVVTTGAQNFNGIKTFNAAGDSSYSTFNSASIVTLGGISVAKNLSAKSIRIDNNVVDEGVSLQYDEDLDTLNFVFV